MAIKIEWNYNSIEKEWYVSKIDTYDNRVISKIRAREYLIDNPEETLLVYSDGGAWGSNSTFGNALYYAIAKNDVEMARLILEKMTNREKYDYFHDKDFCEWEVYSEENLFWGHDEYYNKERTSFADMVKDFKACEQKGLTDNIILNAIKGFNDAFKVALGFYERCEAERDRILAENDRVVE